MSEIDTLNSSLEESLLRTLINTVNEKTSDKTTKIEYQKKNLPSLLDVNTLQELIDGKYDITLREYTNMNTYNSLMSSVYGKNSASPFQKYLNNILDKDDDKLANAKTFVEKMKENGLSNQSAVKLYSALKSYSLISSFNNYSFVSAKI